MSFIPINLLVVCKLISHRQGRSCYSTYVCGEIWFMLCLYWNIKLPAKKKKGCGYGYAARRKSCIGLVLCAHWLQRVWCQLTPVSPWKAAVSDASPSWHEWLSGTQLLGMAWDGFSALAGAGFEPTWQGTGGVCVYVQHSWAQRFFVRWLA